MVQVVTQSITRPKATRRQRNPAHRFFVTHAPWVLQPFFLAPVLAGETLKNCLWQSRAVTAPVKNPLIGWHLEHYVFYYGFSAIRGVSEELQTMMLDPDATAATLGIASTTAAASRGFYPGTATDLVDWLSPLVTCAVEDYFRDEGELAADFTIGSLPCASMNPPGWTQSGYDAALALDAVDPTLTVGVDDVVTGSEVEELMRKWQLARMANLTPLSYEDWLVTQGVRQKAAVQETRELVRFTRNWTYPSNTVDPTSGTPRSALSWSVQERADKDRFFKEPGFLFGLTVARPKIYFDRQQSPIASLMNDPYRWLPLVLNDDVASSIIKRAPAGILDTTADEVMIDIRDLLLYGDQFTNAPVTTGSHVPVKTAWGMNLNDGVEIDGTATKIGKYPADDLAGLFVGANAEDRVLYQDGVVDLTISSRVMDGTP